ncbi:hypothetical protein [Pelagibaculum spongiae]|uniref:PilC beta-propeller domain-containing protein n=1 Tax=Pelagibaculum spongiae TaxID=2080658 RepID=A0A2V1H348_9GAMM|nr:hypothetical protein [Pelagibaculum spongiae]PVZ70429.1 hypothetical protein DC094_07510 [Pelagibaculum spongiae]
MRINTFLTAVLTLLVSSVAYSDSLDIYANDEANIPKRIMVVFDNSSESDKETQVPSTYDHAVKYNIYDENSPADFERDQLYWTAFPLPPTPTTKNVPNGWIQEFNADTNYCLNSAPSLISDGKWKGKIRRYRFKFAVDANDDGDAATLLLGNWELYLGLNYNYNGATAAVNNQLTYGRIDCLEDHVDSVDSDDLPNDSGISVVNSNASTTSGDALYMADDILGGQHFPTGYTDDPQYKEDDSILRPNRYLWTGNYLNFYWHNRDLKGRGESHRSATHAQIYAEAIDAMVKEYPSYEYGLATFNENGGDGGWLCYPTADWPDGDNFFRDCNWGSGIGNLIQRLPIVFRDRKDYSTVLGINHGGRISSVIKNRTAAENKAAITNKVWSMFEPHSVNQRKEKILSLKNEAQSEGAAPGETMYEVAQYLTGGYMSPWANGFRIKAANPAGYIGSMIFNVDENGNFKSYPQYPAMDNSIKDLAKGLQYDKIKDFAWAKSGRDFYFEYDGFANWAEGGQTKNDVLIFPWPGNKVSSMPYHAQPYYNDLNIYGSYKYPGSTSDVANLPLGQCGENYLFLFGGDDTYQGATYKDTRYHNGRFKRNVLGRVDGRGILNNNTYVGDLIPRLFRTSLWSDDSNKNLSSIEFWNKSSQDEMAEWFSKVDLYPGDDERQNMVTHVFGAKAPLFASQSIETAIKGQGAYHFVRSGEEMLRQLSFLEEDKFISSGKGIAGYASGQNGNSHTGKVIVSAFEVNNGKFDGNLYLADKDHQLTTNILSGMQKIISIPEYNESSHSSTNIWVNRKIMVRPKDLGDALVPLNIANIDDVERYVDTGRAVSDEDQIKDFFLVEPQNTLVDLIQRIKGKGVAREKRVSFIDLVGKCTESVNNNYRLDDPASRAIKANLIEECVESAGKYYHLFIGSKDALSDLEREEYHQGYVESDYNRWPIGGVQNNKPVIVNYKQNINSVSKVAYLASSQGLVHAFDVTAETGYPKNINQIEKWAFLPLELGGQLQTLFADEEGIKKYGINAQPVAYISDLARDGVDASQGDKAWLFFGTGRGGGQYGMGGYYALDITNPDTPKYLWFKKYPMIQQSWSEPVLARIPGYLKDGVPAPVIIFGGGYDQSKDTVWGPDAFGRNIYIADAETGDLVWGFGADFPMAKSATDNTEVGQQVTEMKHSIPGRISAMDSNGDGIVDRLYVADSGAEVWRIDMPGNAIPASTVLNSWQVNKVAYFGSSSWGSSGRRSFMFGLDVVRSQDEYGPYDGLILATGNPERTKEYLNSSGNIPATADRNTSNFIFMVKDRSIATGIVDTSNWPIAGGSPLLNSSNQKLGWALRLTDQIEAPTGSDAVATTTGERATGRPYVVNGTVFVNTFVSPPMTQPSSCIVGDDLGIGHANTYAIDLNDGRASDFILNNVSLKTKFSESDNRRTSSDSIQTLLPTPVAYVGQDGISILGATTKVPGLALPPPTTSSFWQQLIGSELSEAYKELKDYLF